MRIRKDGKEVLQTSDGPVEGVSTMQNYGINSTFVIAFLINFKLWTTSGSLLIHWFCTVFVAYIIIISWDDTEVPRIC